MQAYPCNPEPRMRHTRSPLYARASAADTGCGRSRRRLGGAGEAAAEAAFRRGTRILIAGGEVDRAAATLADSSTGCAVPHPTEVTATGDWAGGSGAPRVRSADAGAFCFARRPVRCPVVCLLGFLDERCFRDVVGVHSSSLPGKAPAPSPAVPLCVPRGAQLLCFLRLPRG